MEKIWLEQYPEGIPHEVDLNEFSSLKDIIEKSCAKFHANKAFTNFGKSITYGELEEQSRHFAAFLQKVVGLKKGDRVALMMPNLLQYPIACFGVLRAGGVVVNVNPLYTPRELEHQLKDSGAKTILILENFAHVLQEVIANADVSKVITTQIGDALPGLKGKLMSFAVKYIKKMVPTWSLPGSTTYKKAMTEGKWQEMDEVALSLEDTAFLQYTGGTTGVSKGAQLTHGNMVANLQQASAWISTKTKEGDEAIITALPLYHIFSLTANCLVFMKLGAENILITNPRDFDGFVKTLANTRFTAITGVNTLFNALLHTPGFRDIDFSALRLTLGGGMAVQKAVAEDWQNTTGVALLEAYGLTETSPAASMNPMNNLGFNGSIGLPISSTEFSIRNEAGEELPIGETGEICIKGPQVMKGYWNRPDATAETFFPEGWLRTGDIGHCDDKGYFYISDRKKDMILTSGFNVYPNEVEGVAVTHPNIVEAAAVGVPHPRSGEVVKLFVVSDNPALTEKEVIEFCRENMTAYKVPKHVEFRDELPKSNVGKILRRHLRDEAQS
ncbi:MAG: AMP-binding protein [Gammaproteobacteria bacterium]|nr:AMP-binding protein [Gammaproteobacteria bacterium]NNC97923.1 AMP-binding protein [Gammaproteobacteria bacterium]